MLRKAIALALGVCLLSMLAVGAASAQEDTEDEQIEYPVEPPTDQPLPGHEEIRREDDTDEKIALGEQLYFEPRISETGTISCNTCHNVMEGGDDSRPTASGVHGQVGPVASPTVWNSAFHSTQFWDGRADTLAEQAEGPIVADVEMGMPDHEAALDRVSANEGYREQFEEVYGDDEVTLDRVTDAIAAYERTLITPNSSYDRYVEGETDALTEQQLDGMETFQEVGCTTCHAGPAFSGQGPGTAFEAESGDFYGHYNPQYEDNEQCQEYVDRFGLMEHPGRMGVTDDEADEFLYKVPTLRNVEHTASVYATPGQVTNLEDAIHLMGACQLDEDLDDEEVDDIRAFLTSLTGEYPEMTMPRLPTPSGESMMPFDEDAQLEDVADEEDPFEEGADDEMDDEMDDEPEPEEGLPGFGAIVGLAALLSAAGLVALRRVRVDE